MRIRHILLGLALLPVGSVAQAQTPIATGDVHLKKIVAVSRFENRAAAISGADYQLTDGLADQLTDALIQSNAFVVLERDTIDDVMDEQDFAQSGRVATSQSARTGQITSAQILIKGTITEFDQETSGNKSGIGIRGIRIGSAKSTAHVGLIIRLIDATTSQVVASRRVEGKVEGKGLRLGLDVGGFSFDNDSFKETPMGKATQIAIDEAVEFIAQESRKVSYSARVVKVDSSGQAIISGGSMSGIAPGMSFVVMSVQGELKDPFTGELLGYDQKELGVVTVGRVFDRFAYTNIVRGMKVGDFAHLR